MASTLLKLIRAERARRSSAPLVEVIWSDLEGPDFCKTDQEFDQRVEALRRAGRIGPRTMVVRFARNGEGRPDPAADAHATSAVQEPRTSSPPQGTKPHWSEGRD